MINEIKNIYKNKYNFIDDLKDIHTLLNTDLISPEDKEYHKIIPIFGKTCRKSVFVRDFYEFYDKDSILNNSYIHLINTQIKPLFKEDKLIVQKTPNIRIHIPNCTNIGKLESDPNETIIGLHNDNRFGHPEEEINFVYAITDMYDTNSIYYESLPNSNIKIEKFNNLKLKSGEIWYGHLNKCLHYNKINKTNKTRISLDFRVIPYSNLKKNNKSVSFHSKKFIVGDYYTII